MCRRNLVHIRCQFDLTEGANFQFRAEFFNALNHTNLGTPKRFVNTPQFGTIDKAATPGCEYSCGAPRGGGRHVGGG
jgi:hypothetical protein